MNTQCVIDAITTAVNGLNFLVFVSIVITSVVLALVFSPVVLRRYQRRVEALMATGLTESTDKAGEFVEASPSTASPQPPNQEKSNRDALLGAAQGGLQRLYKTQFLSIALFATFTTVTITYYYMIENEEPIYLTRAWLENSIYPLVVAVGGTAPLFLMNMLNRRLKLRLCVFFGVVLILAAFYSAIYEEELSSDDMLYAILISCLFIILMYVAVFGRRLRNVVPMFALFVFMLFCALLALDVVAAAVLTCLSWDFVLVEILLVLAMCWASYRFGFMVLKLVTTAYERQAFSERQLQFGLWALLLCLILTLEVGFEEDAALDISTLGILAGFISSCLAYRQLVRRLKPWPSPRSLLLLRVFSADTHSQSLLDDLSFRWSFIGPIYLVGGPDLARAYLEPHELLLFLRRRMGELFVFDKATLHKWIDQLEDRPDPDTRYRTNEFFCIESTWQATVKQLIEVSNYVLLDLRGFNAERKGAEFEITLLAKMQALSRTIILVDSRTDRAAISSALDLVPNVENPPVNELKVTDSLESLDVLRSLLDVERGRI